jgi:hypothetical protein
LEGIKNHNIKITDKSFEDASKMCHLDMAVTNQYYIHKAINSSINVRNACCSLHNDYISREEMGTKNITN